jgi:hypothetical protein
MTIKFNAVKEERKALVKAIGEVLGMEVKYLGAPGFAFAVGGLIIDRNGTVGCGDQMSGSDVAALLAALAERGFVPAETSAFETEDTPAEYGDAGTLVIEWPDEGFDAVAFDNLIKLAAGKATLIKKALGQNLSDGAETLPILREDGKLRFPWFDCDMAFEEIGAWSHFIGALCVAAKKQKRVTLKEKALDPGASEKFAFRCYLLKLGFIGAEYKDVRKILLARLVGNGSHKTGDGKKPVADIGFPDIGSDIIQSVEPY